MKITTKTIIRTICNIITVLILTGFIIQLSYNAWAVYPDTAGLGTVFVHLAFNVLFAGLAIFMFRSNKVRYCAYFVAVILASLLIAFFVAWTFFPH